MKGSNKDILGLVSGGGTDWYRVIGFFLLTLLLANFLAWIIEWRRNVRIKTKAETLASKREQRQLPPVPVSIVTGFLGAGKTTLLNRILTSSTLGLRIAVIENEVGAISIDHSLLKEGHEGIPEEGIFVLKNGCMCCTTKSTGNEVERVLDVLLRIADMEQYDYILIETTGLADPGPIIQTFLRIGRKRFFLDGVITLVDAKHIGKHLAGASGKARMAEAERQIAYADVLGINKTDLVSEEELNNVTRQLKDVNASATILYASNSGFPFSNILNIRAFSESSLPDTLETVSQGIHTEHVSSESYRVRGVVDLDRVNSWLTRLSDINRGTLYRFKGILALGSDAGHCVVQGVMETFTLSLTRVSKVDKETSEMVFIGKHLDSLKLKQGLESCFVGEHSFIFSSDSEGKQQNQSH